jgi:hypothetical protein
MLRRAPDPAARLVSPVSALPYSHRWLLPTAWKATSHPPVESAVIIKSRLKEQERHMRRVGWRQGLVYAIFGAAVAVAVVVFSHLLPTIK